MRSAPRWDVVAAHACVWLVWGSTYLAIRIAIEDNLPPLGMSSARFTVAGLIMYGFLRARGVAPPSPVQWRTTAIVGVLLIGCGNGAVSWAEKTVPSGLVALTVAVLPAWIVLLEWLLRGTRPARPLVIGLVVGFLGVMVLVGPDEVLGSSAVPLGAALLLMAGSATWAGGSIYARSTELPPSPFMATAAEMICGGVFLGALSLVLGELRGFDPSTVSWVGVAAWLYLVVFGAIVAFTAYIYLLGKTTAAQASSYAFVNPIIAVMLGAAVLGEPLDRRVVLAVVLIVGAVVLISRYREPAGAQRK